MVTHIKRTPHLYTHSTYRLASSSTNVLDMIEAKTYNTPEELAHLQKTADMAELKLKYDPEFQPLDDNESGRMEKRLCNIYSAYQELKHISRFLGIGAADAFGATLSSRMERYRQLAQDAECLLDGLHEEENRAQTYVSRHTITEESEAKYHNAFTKAAGRLEVDLDKFIKAITNLGDFEESVY